MAITALEFLPIELFPQLFMKPSYGSCNETLIAMVQVWPFVHLALEGLMESLICEPYKQCWMDLTSCLFRRITPGEV